MELLFALSIRKPRGYSLITVLCEAPLASGTMNNCGQSLSLNLGRLLKTKG